MSGKAEIVKISPHVSQKQLRFDDDTGVRKYHEVCQEVPLAGRRRKHQYWQVNSMCCISSPVADTGGILQKDHVISHVHEAPDHRTMV